MSISEKRIFRSYGMITMGTFLMALGTCLIYEPMSMVTGGFSGVGIVLEKLFGIPVFAVTFLLNVPLFFMARKFHTREYLFRSLYAMITFSLALAVIPVTSVTHQDYLMAAILGGAFHGGGLGLVFLAGSSTGGTDLLSTLLHPLFPMMRLANRNCRWYNCCCRYAGFWCADGTVFHCGGFCDFESNGWSDIRNALCKNYVYHFRPVGRNCRNYSAPI